MKTRELVVVEPGRIEVQEADLAEELAPHEILVETEHSIVSAGTEGAGFTGLVREMPFGDAGRYPRGTGYGNLGRVLAAGSPALGCAVGDRVLTFARHASHAKADAGRFALPVPDGPPGEHLVFTRMAGVSISALRSSSVQPGTRSSSSAWAWWATSPPRSSSSPAPMWPRPISPACGCNGPASAASSG